MNFANWQSLAGISLFGTLTTHSVWQEELFSPASPLGVIWAARQQLPGGWSISGALPRCTGTHFINVLPLEWELQIEWDVLLEYLLIADLSVKCVSVPPCEGQPGQTWLTASFITATTGENTGTSTITEMDNHAAEKINIFICLQTYIRKWWLA